MRHLIFIIVLATLIGLTGCGQADRPEAGCGTCPKRICTEPATKPLCQGPCGGTGKVASKDQLAAIRAGKSIRIGVKADTPPFGKKVGANLVGFDVDIAHAVADRVGAEKVDLVSVTSANRMEKLLAGDVDLVVASMTITRSRDREVDFSLPYYQDGQALLVGPQSAITSYRDLAGKPVGAVKGSTSAANLLQAAPSAKVVEFADFDALVQGLINGTVEAVTSDRVILVGLAAIAGEKAGLKVVGESFSTEPYGIALRPNQSALRDAVNEALQAMWEDGSYRGIAETWFGPKTRFAGLPVFTITPYPR